MGPAEPGVEQPSATVPSTTVPSTTGPSTTGPSSGPRLDPDSAEWLAALAGTGPPHEAALARLHAMLVRVARREAARRAPRLQIAGPELDDLADQAAADALLAIIRKLGQFKG